MAVVAELLGAVAAVGINSSGMGGPVIVLILLLLLDSVVMDLYVMMFDEMVGIVVIISLFESSSMIFVSR